MSIPLPEGIRSRIITDVNGLDMHVLDAGDPAASRRLLLLHGFPELAFSWRRVMLPLAAAGYYVIAPDQRGYGRTTGWSDSYDGDLAPFRLPALVRDQLALLVRLGFDQVDGVIGHDFGSPVAACCALMRGDVFRAVVLMSAPFEGLPAFPGPVPESTATGSPDKATLDTALAALHPPRKHYQHYYCTQTANTDMVHAPQGLSDFLRAYFHAKSADWEGNAPHQLASWGANQLAVMPGYYIMQRDQTMAETVMPAMPTLQQEEQCLWLTPEALAFYTAEYARTGFQGGLNWYRCTYAVEQFRELQLFAGRTIDVPSLFIAGDKDWGAYQRPGALDTMVSRACTQMQAPLLVPDAGHWVQQEQPDAVVDHVLGFLR